MFTSKATPSKLDEICKVLRLGAHETDKLIDCIATALDKAKCDDTNLNALSNNIVSDAVYALTDIRLNGSNFCCYKSNINITAEIAQKLNLPTFRYASCNIQLVNSNFHITPKNYSAAHAFLNLLKMTSISSTANYYEPLKNQGFNVGDKRNWCSREVITFCQRHDIKPNFPVSHQSPTALRLVFRWLKNHIYEFETRCPATISLGEYINQQISAVCNADLKKKSKLKPDWLQNHHNLPPVSYYSEIPADKRRYPYIYCKNLDKYRTKFGKADASVRFNKLDEGMVICLKREHESTAYDVEQCILNILRGIGICALNGTNEQFQAKTHHLCNVVLDICSATPSIKSKIHSIIATNNYDK